MLRTDCYIVKFIWSENSAYISGHIHVHAHLFMHVPCSVSRSGIFLERDMSHLSQFNVDIWSVKFFHWFSFDTPLFSDPVLATACTPYFSTLVCCALIVQVELDFKFHCLEGWMVNFSKEELEVKFMLK
uniref:Uncharacterized protein n=1 Tax=Onchocerca volvulus TaxID=6282 RepID=A0A8R1TTW1_ONCVO